jgi:hypothetical protein
VVGFYQCIAAVPSVFDVTPPPGLDQYTRWVNLLQRPADLESIFLPTVCLGSYRIRILFGSVWPIILILIFAAGFIAWECVLERRANKKDRTRLPRGSLSIVQAGLYRVLPLTLGLTFVLVPSTSTRIFKTFRTPFGIEPNTAREPSPLRLMTAESLVRSPMWQCAIRYSMTTQHRSHVTFYRSTWRLIVIRTSTTKRATQQSGCSSFGQ